MKFTLSWLKDHLDTSASLDDISKTLTAIGLEVEAIHDKSAELKTFTVAKILEAEKHPEADKLRVCKVESDAGILQIVCGAANARAGIYVVLAKEGAHIPGNSMVIKKTKIRGIESNGMLCSADELALGGESDGIIELPEAKIGTSIVEVLGLGDPVIEIAITPNRADCLGVHGVARDLAAAGLGKLKPLSINAFKGTFASPINVNIATENCLQFIGCYIKGVKNGPSPDWLKKRLEAIGQKSISALVDITNYITFDLGRPLHVYDAKKLHGNIHVRDAKKSETIKALNGKDYTLDNGITVIADDSTPVAIGGVIGGEPTGCTAETTDIFLEVALFNPTSVAQTGRALQIDSDARYRFERGIDVDFVESGAQIAVAMINKLCGGQASNLVIAGKTPQWQRSFHLPVGKIASLGGIEIPKTKAEEIFKALGFGCSAENNGWAISPPSWRADIEGDADLVEEILRIHGYDHIPATPLPKLSGFSKPALSLQQKRAHIAKRTLASKGFTECQTWSFLPEAQAKLFGGGDTKLKLLNPISADLDSMRPNLLPNLLDAAKRNAARGFKNINLFETGLQFTGIAPNEQRMVATAISTGSNNWLDHGNGLLKQYAMPVSAFCAKTYALSVLQALGVNKADITTNVPAWYHPGRSGALTLGGKIILGYFGELHPAILKKFDIETSAVGFEIFLDALPAPRARGKARAALKLSDFQAVERDFAFTVDEKVTASDILKAIAQADKNLITDVALFDVYAGKGIEAGKKSIAVKVTLQANDRTLSEQDLTTASNAIVAAAMKFGGQLRQ